MSVPWWDIPLLVVYVGDARSFEAYVTDRAELAWSHGGVRSTRRVVGQLCVVGKVEYRRIGGTRRSDVNGLRGLSGPAAIVWGGVTPRRPEVDQEVKAFVAVINRSVVQVSEIKTIEFYVEGRPAPQGSKNIGEHGQMREQSPYLTSWAGGWKGGKAKGRRIHGAVEVGLFKWFRDNGIDPTELPIYAAGVAVDFTVTFYVDTDPTDPPDWDKLSRSTGDALTYGRAWADDGQVTDAHVRIRSADLQHPAGAFISIREATP